MATLALAAAGAAAGSALLPSGLSILGATISGATIGTQIGSLVGSYVDQALLGFSGRTKRISGPRLSDLTVTGSTEGAAIPRVYGQVRLGGQIIWARDIEEVAVTRKAGGRGKGGGGGGSPQVVQTDYQYFGTFAVALAEGVVSGLGRVWADGREFDLSGATWRLHPGTETQEPDTLIAAVEGAERAPAFRGVAYVVFERLALSEFGNRIPQLSFEVARATDDLDQLIRGVVMIPSSGEFVYATQAVTRDGDGGRRVADNVHTRSAATDWAASVDQLQAQLPQADSVSLTVAWFGDDLDPGRCTVTPRVDRSSKDTRPLTWSVAGLMRSDARVVSRNDGRPAYGGTPSDATVVSAIRDLTERGLKVTYTPFLLMDVPAGNGLIDPVTGAAGQPAYPWRGRIVPRASAQLTPAAADDIARFVGSCSPSNFTLVNGTVIYHGTEEWSYRRFVLHQAFLAKAAGGVDAFLIGSEMRGLTTARDARGSYPFVRALVQLAADVKSVLGTATKVSYAADWSEYFGHQPSDGTGDVFFHLDPLWSSPAVDAIAIDLYWPLADWRDGDHADRRAGARSVYDVTYLKANIAGGEGFDWYYASAADRAAQRRTPITDGLGKPWVFRIKDLKSWWMNQHHDRPGGIERAAATGWVPQSKPVWLMEVGCPAVDKGANQPNVFVDPKSSETNLPYFSDGRRDDLMQRRYVRALVEAYTPGHQGAVAGLNPLSSVYGGPMVPPERIHVYAWDARPYPAFPSDGETWGDAENWHLGHWITGRLARGSLAETMSLLLADMGVADADTDTSELAGVVPGYVIDRIMSGRDALEPLELAYFFDSVESGGKLRFQPRGSGEAVLTVGRDDLVEARPEASLCTVRRGQEAELPSSAKLTFLSAENGYRQAVAEARRVAGASGRIAEAQLPIVLDAEHAVRIAESWLFETWAARERATFTLPPSTLAIEAGDVVSLDSGSGPRQFRIVETGDHGAREVEAISFDAAVYAAAEGIRRGPRRPDAVVVGQPTVIYLDLPAAEGTTGITGCIAAAANPWPGSLAVYRSPDTAGYVLATRIHAAATLGRTSSALPRGPASRIDHVGQLTIELEAGALASVTPVAMLAGANTAALRATSGRWEIFQFERADLVGPATYRLSRLLRGQAGTEDLIEDLLPAGAQFVLLDAAVTRLELALADIATPIRWRVGPAGRDIGHPDYVEAVAGFAGRALKPLAPVHLRAWRRDRDVVITWVRRTRIDGDSWVVEEVPLGESEERYRVEILGGAGQVIRTMTVTSPSASYLAGEQLSDFGVLPDRISVRVAQISPVAGPGIFASANL